MNFSPADIRRFIRAATRRTGSPLHDEDLEQEAALRAVEAFRRIRDIRHPRALLMKIVSDAVRDHWRRKRPSEDLSAVDEYRVAQSPAFEEALDRARQRDLLHAALAALEENKRSTVQLFYLEGHSVPEIARLQGKSTSAVKMELMRSRRELSGIVSLMSKKKSPQSRHSGTKSSPTL